MTTASRPTFNAAIGHADRGGSLRGVASRAVSAKDGSIASSLSYRQEGQNAPKEARNRDFKAELEERERRAKEKRAPDEQESDRAKRPRLELKEEKEDVGDRKRFRAEDKDDSDSSDSDSDSDDDSDDDETAELMRELERIQKERAEESKRQDQQRAQADLTLKAESAMFGNPLLNDKQDFTVKKKWYEDTVFRNQTRTAPEPKKARFINDTIRNDFHKKFLYKYIK